MTAIRPARERRSVERSGTFVRRFHRWTGRLLLAVAVTVTCDPAWAKDDEDEEPRWGGQVSIEEGYTDNVRADAIQRLGAFYTTLEGQAWWRTGWQEWLPHRVGAVVKGRVYSDFSNRDFAEFGPNFAYTWKRLALSVEYRYSPDTLRVDPAATADAFADLHDLSVELRSRFGARKRWTAIVTFDSEWEFYDPDFRARTFFEETITAGLRCRATDLIAPRASVAYSLRDAISQNYDREEVALEFGADFYLPAGLRGLVRYEKAWRNFLVGYAERSTGGFNNNFGREDDANEVEIGLDVPIPRLESTRLGLRYRYKDNLSSRADRSYHTNEGSLKLTYDF